MCAFNDGRTVGRQRSPRGHLPWIKTLMPNQSIVRLSFHRRVGLAAWTGALIALVGVTAGCNRDSLNLAAVEGTVLLDGAPVADAGVVFAPTDAEKALPAVGSTDAEGRFTLITANRPGAMVGNHRVAISKTETIAIPQKRGFPIYKFKEHLPKKFGDFETSGLTAKVEDDDNEVKFELSSK